MFPLRYQVKGRNNNNVYFLCGMIQMPLSSLELSSEHGFNFEVNDFIDISVEMILTI